MAPVSTNSYPARGLLVPAVDVPDRWRLAFLPLHIVVTTLVAVVGFGAVGLQLYESPDSHGAIALVTGAAAIGLIAYARYFLALPWLSASIVYLMLFWVFHFGMTFTVAVFPSALLRLEDFEIEWYYWPNVRLAMVLGLIGATGFVFGVGLTGGAPSSARPTPVDSRDDRSLYLGGWLIMLVGIAASVGVVAVYVGPDVFSIGYINALEVAGGTILGAALGMSHLGCLLAVCGAMRKDWIKPCVVWGACIALPMLLVGARAGAMISLLGFAVILTYRGVRFRRSLILVSVLVALFVIPAIEAFRSVGFANRSTVDWTDVAPVDTFLELGGSLQATKAYVDWIENGDPYLLGLSYWAPFDRQLLTRVLPGRETIPYDQDERVPQRLMVPREGPLGGSATGEAYYNFGTIGPFLYFAFVGALFGWLERFCTKTSAGCVALGVVMFVFYFNIRGDWLSVPATIAEGLALLAGCLVVSRIVGSRWSRGRGESVPGLPAVIDVRDSLSRRF